MNREMCRRLFWARLTHRRLIAWAFFALGLFLEAVAFGWSFVAARQGEQGWWVSGVIFAIGVLSVWINRDVLFQRPFPPRR